MKPKYDGSGAPPGKLDVFRVSTVLRDRDSRRRALFVALTGLACLLAYIGFGAFSGAAGLGGFEVGMVADRDIVAEDDVIYIDAQATKVRTDAELRLVPAVFSVDDGETRTALVSLAEFKKGFLELATATGAREELALKVKGRYPDLAATDLPSRLAEFPSPSNAMEQGRLILDALMTRGVFAIPDTGLERYNPENVELRRWTDGPLVYEQLPLEKATTLRRVRPVALEIARGLKMSATLSALAADLAAAFARENAFFDSEQSRRRLEAAQSRVEPVMRRISKGDRIIRKGFLVTMEDMERLAAIRGSGEKLDPLFVVAGALLVGILGLGSISVLGRTGTGARLTEPGFLFVLVLAGTYFVAACALAVFLPSQMFPNLESFLPTALASMLVAILVNERFAILYTVLIASSLVAVTGFDAFGPAQALISGIAGIVLVRHAERRIDLVRAGAQLALVRLVCGFTLAALSDHGLAASFGIGFLSAINGFLCAVLTLSFLPVLEHMLNAPTVFRLHELSDLNAPALKRLLSVAPGTYSHSVTVAHLAESACREIGADALLARVGAYYHDIGKIEKPEYFIENQSGYNKHDDINPRLSATVLRGHVKFGLERADALRLPEPVRAIIAEHHGSSLISYFFAQAQKEDGEVNAEEFRYPGPPPSSKESAVVMLADCVEAASRTLKRPTIGRLDQFVREIVKGRHENGQLAMSDLTFRDLELIMNSFVRVLSGHFHSRIEYPKTREPS